MLTVYPKITQNNFRNNYLSLKNQTNFSTEKNTSDIFLKTSAKHLSSSINFTSCFPSLKNEYSIEKIIGLIKSDDVNRIALISHKVPDGDAAGSMLALANQIKEASGKIADIFILNPLQENFKFIDPHKRIKVISKILGPDASAEQIANKFEPYDLAISVDTATAELHDGNIYEGIFKRAKHTVDIDHHNKTKGIFADTNLTDISAISTSQIIMQFINPLGLNTKKINPKIAEPILLGLITDARQFAQDVSKLIRGDVHQLKSALEDNNFKKLIKNISKLNAKECKVYRNILKNSLKYNDDKSIAYFVYNDTKEDGLCTKNIIGHVFQKLADKNNSIKYYFAVITDTNGKTSASIRSKTKPIDSSIEELGGGGHSHACAIPKCDKSTEKLTSLIIDKLNDLENSSIPKIEPPPDTKLILAKQVFN